MTHMHNLRPSELYVMLETGADLLRFCAAVSRNLGLCTSEQTDNYRKEFRRAFDRRLRERHRIVHGHERPSLATRVLEFAASSPDKEQITDALSDMVLKIAETFSQIRGEAVEDSLEAFRRGEMKRIYDEAFGKETIHMWKLLSGSIERTFNFSSC